MHDELSSADDERLATLRATLDEGIAELDAGLGVEMSVEELMTEVLAQVRLDP